MYTMNMFLALHLAAVITSSTAAHRSTKFFIRTINRTRLNDQACGILESVHVTMFNITQPSTRRKSCACSIQPPDGATHTMSLTVQQTFDRYASRMELADHVWKSAGSLSFVISDNKVTLRSCDLTYEQQLPISFLFGEESGAILSCSESSDANVVDMGMDCNEKPPNNIDATKPAEIPTHHHHHASLSQGYLLLIIGMCIMVIINIIVTVSLRVTFKQQRRAKASHRRASVFRRQQTNLSHPYESILIENEDLRTIDTMNGPVGYLAMDRISRERLNNVHINPEAVNPNIDIANVTIDESNVYIDMQVYTLSTCYEFSPNPDRNPPNTEYSYTYSSCDDMNAMLNNTDRKASLQSIASASGAQAMTRVKEMARIFESTTSFDSRYADKTVKIGDTNEQSEDASAYIDLSGSSSPQLSESSYYNLNTDSKYKQKPQAVSPQGTANGY